MATPTTVDEYLADLAPAQRTALEDMRRTVNAAAPDATESIAYDMPALRSRGGQFVVSYAAYKNHYSLFPASQTVVAALGDELTPYLAGKATVRFPTSRPIPLDLVRRIVEIRVTETEAADRH
ncbi:MAG: iron chaperone [Chloroflexota bacterium]